MQKGIEYAPHNDFYAFDIKLNGITYLDTEIINRIFEETGFSMQEPCSRNAGGSFEVSQCFNSKIPGWFGLPELNNMCEGPLLRL
ncbi:hypothetical protein EJ377_12535 (plasmid) [Chryseobacterium arthrosphaerae]|uniref:RNA ligase domain-containing protein n=1 Tax=Chryseobacterium arthrosphaerae TaxID=651561 RepID=A0A3S0NN33_9FLAO|nr:hypothetical protein EJ377_12535 [Chryseobacterium arthrosphaerae]